ncbi:hypothetical protein D3C73_1215500 [compost metagenome]
MLDGRVGRDSFQTTKVTAVAALAQRLYLNMANLANVAVTANKNASIGDYPGTGSAMHSHQNGVFAVLTCPEIVLGKCQTTDIVTNKAGHLEPFFQRLDQPPVFNLNMRHIANDATFRVNQAWQNNGDGN